MSRRSFGLTILAYLYVMSGFLAIVFWVFFFLPMLGKPASFIAAFQSLFSPSSFLNTLHLYYQTTWSIAYFLVGVGLWRLRGWAYRLNFFLLGIELLEKFLMILYFYLHKFPHPSNLWGEGVWMVFLILFFRRASIRDQFED